MQRTGRVATDVVCFVLMTNCWNVNMVMAKPKSGRVEAHQELDSNQHRSIDVHEPRPLDTFVQRNPHNLENMLEPSISWDKLLDAHDISDERNINGEEVWHGARIRDLLGRKRDIQYHRRRQRVKRSPGNDEKETEKETPPEQTSAENKASVVVSEGNSSSIPTNGSDDIPEDNTMDVNQGTLEKTDQSETANTNQEHGGAGESAKDRKTKVPKLKEVQPPASSGAKQADESDTIDAEMQKVVNKTVGRTGAGLSNVGGQNVTGNSTLLKPLAGIGIENPSSKGNISLPVFYRNREQDVTSATICVSAILILMFGIILYSRMWQRKDQWLSMSVTLGESEPPQHTHITPSKLSIKDLIDGKLKLIQAQFKRIQKRKDGQKIQKNGKYKRVRNRDDSVDKSDSEDEIYTR